MGAPLREAAEAALERQAQAAGCDLAEFATALQVARLMWEGKRPVLHALQAGDGAIAAGDPEQGLDVVASPSRGAAYNAVYFITSDSWVGRLVKARMSLTHASGVLATSDGAVPVLFDKDWMRVFGACADIMPWGQFSKAADWESMIRVTLEEDLRPLLADDPSLGATVCAAV